MDIINLKLLFFKKPEEDCSMEVDYRNIALGFCGTVNPHFLGLEKGAATYELVLFKKIMPFSIETYSNEIKQGKFSKLLWKDENNKKYRTLPTLTKHLTLNGFRSFYENSNSVEDFIKKGKGLSKFLGGRIYY